MPVPRSPPIDESHEPVEQAVDDELSDPAAPDWALSSLIPNPAAPRDAEVKAALGAGHAMEGGDAGWAGLMAGSGPTRAPIETSAADSAGGRKPALAGLASARRLAADTETRDGLDRSAALAAGAETTGAGAIDAKLAAASTAGFASTERQLMQIRIEGPALTGPDAASTPGAAVLPPATSGGPTATPTDGVPTRLSAGPGSPAFAAELGATLSTFIRQGVQHARLELHPVEMGPLTVQIQLNGQTAQVHLAAENGHTRQALEQSMPQLAGSLREAGLTLTGGGVSEQPRPREDEPAGARSRQPGGDAAGGNFDDTSRAAVQVRRRGVVDLVA